MFTKLSYCSLVPAILHDDRNPVIGEVSLVVQPTSVIATAILLGPHSGAPNFIQEAKSGNRFNKFKRYCPNFKRQ
jgi:hypothetical protein